MFRKHCRDNGFVGLLGTSAFLLSVILSGCIWNSSVEAAQPRDAVRQSSKSTRTDVRGQLAGLRESFEQNTELFIYGGLAAIGILIMGLAIGSAS